MRRVDKKAFGARLKQRMDELGIKQPALAKAVGMKQQGINSILQGDVARPRLLREIAAELQTTEEWLLWNQGSKQSDDEELTNTRDLQSISRIQPGILELDIRAGMGGGGFPTHELLERGEYRDAMKSEAWHFPTWFLRQELRATADKLIVVETQGDSMLPTIAPGEPVVVNIAHLVPTPDGIYALRDRWGSVIVKRLQVLRKGDPPRILVISDNKAHSDEEVGADEIQIVGRVLCSLRRL